MNWILIGFTSLMTAFVLFIRITEVIKFRKSYREFMSRNSQYDVLMQDKKTIWLYGAMAIVAAVFALMVEGELFERVALSILFLLLVASEGANAWMHSSLYSSSKDFLYGLVSEKYRSIKTYKPKGKRKMILVTLRNEEHIIPLTVSEKLQAEQKRIKNAKK